MFSNPYQVPQWQPAFGQPTFQEVEGPESIQMLRIPPNSKQVYFDRRLDRFYTVSTDAAGAKYFEAYDFVPAQEPKQPEYLTVDAFNAWRSQYEQPVPQPTATHEPVAASQPVQQPAGGAAPSPANAPIRANYASPVRPGPQMG